VYHKAKCECCPLAGYQAVELVRGLLPARMVGRWRKEASYESHSSGKTRRTRSAETPGYPAHRDPGPGQAVVRIVAAGVNFVDVGQRRGTYPRQVPFTPGMEGAGVVESVGEGVRSVKPSDRVAFTGLPGAYSEAILADAERLIPLPDELTFEEGAAFPLQGMTAHYLIHEFRRPVPGSFVLIHAAAGGMGGLLVQWAKHLGAHVRR
jgi:NADPH:quinone reductase-like Zn-dependent oxidoreductase